MLYVFREARDFGRPAVRVVVNQEPAGTLRPGEYLALTLPPGEHYVRVELDSEDTRLVRLAAGESIYLRVVTGRFRARLPTIEQPETRVARELIASTVRASR